MTGSCLTIRYSCALCRLQDVEVLVRFRSSSEDIIDWMKQVVEPSLSEDHQKRSPDCHPETLTQIKIPLPPGKNASLAGLHSNEEERMTTKKGFCSKHQHMLANRLKFYGLWDKVKAVDAAGMVDIARAWMAGQLRREMICPLVVTGLELQAKANRMADQMGGTRGAHVTTCPLCAIQRMANDQAADVKVINGQCEVTLALMQSNGLAGGDPSPALRR